VSGPQSVTIRGRVEQVAVQGSYAGGRGGIGGPGGNIESVGPLETMPAISVPAGAMTCRTNGRAAPGDGGDGIYRRVNAEPAHFAKFRSADRYMGDGETINAADGGWWERIGPVFTPEEFGAVGDCPATGSISGAANDVSAWHQMFRTLKVYGGGIVRYGQGGRIYRIAWTTENHGLVHGANVRMECLGGWVEVDPSLMTDPALLPAPAAGRVLVVGEITCGDPDTLTRADVTIVDMNICTGLTEADLIPGVYWYRPDIRQRTVVDWTALASSAKWRSYGLRLWWTDGGVIEDGYAEGTTNNGLSFFGGRGCYFKGRNVAVGCGFGAVPTTAQNGLHMLGYMHLDDAGLTSKDWRCDTMLASYNKDEGFAWAGIDGLSIGSISGRGNLDRLFEGDSSFRVTDETSASLGQQIPARVEIGTIDYDGRDEDGVATSVQGATIACGNEGRVRIGFVRVRGTTNRSPLAVEFTDGGHVSIGGYEIEDCEVDTSYHLINIEAERVEIGAGKVINCSGSVNSSAIRIRNAIFATVAGGQHDGGMTHGVTFTGDRAATYHEVRDLVSLGTDKAFVRLDVAADVDMARIIDCVSLGANTNGDDDQGFVTITNAASTIGALFVERNIGRFGGDTTAPITITAAVAVGAIRNAVVKGNDFNDPTMLTFASTGSLPRSFNNFAGQFANLVDEHNQFIGQKRVNGTAVPTSGVWGAGDEIYNQQISAPNQPDGFRCMTGGRIATLVGVTATTTSGSNVVTVSDGSNIFPFDWFKVVGVTVRRVVKVVGNTVTLAGNADASVTGAAASLQQPIFKSLYYSTPIFTVATQPVAAENEGMLIYVSNGNAGAKCLAASNGGSWRVVALGAVTSPT